MDWNNLDVMVPTKLLHALLVRFIQEEVALFHSTMNLKAQAQTGIFHQLRVDVMDQGLQHKDQIQNCCYHIKTDDRYNV